MDWLIEERVVYVPRFLSISLRRKAIIRSILAIHYLFLGWSIPTSYSSIFRSITVCSTASWLFRSIAHSLGPFVDIFTILCCVIIAHFESPLFLSVTVRLARSSLRPICCMIVWGYCIRILLPLVHYKDRQFLPSVVFTDSAFLCFFIEFWTWIGQHEQVSCRVWDLSSISCRMEWWNATVYSLHFSTWTRTVWVFGPGIVIYLWFWRVLWRRVCW